MKGGLELIRSGKSRASGHRSRGRGEGLQAQVAHWDSWVVGPELASQGAPGKCMPVILATLSICPQSSPAPGLVSWVR